MINDDDIDVSINDLDLRIVTISFFIFIVTLPSYSESGGVRGFSLNVNTTGTIIALPMIEHQNIKL
jgi:hypothetical protein